MPQMLHPGQAGTIESNDIMITLIPSAPGTGLQIELTSPVIKQYGEEIKAVIVAILQEKGITDARVHANDKGALEYTIRARVETAIARAMAKGGLT